MAAPTKLVKATVSRGRTVVAEGKSFGPGATVEITSDDAAFLRSRGFLTVAGVEELTPSIGPVFDAQSNRVSVEH